MLLSLAKRALQEAAQKVLVENGEMYTASVRCETDDLHVIVHVVDKTSRLTPGGTVSIRLETDDGEMFACERDKGGEVRFTHNMAGKLLLPLKAPVKLALERLY